MVDYGSLSHRQGRIITQNASLLAVLKERSMEKSSVTTLTDSPPVHAASSSITDDEDDGNHRCANDNNDNDDVCREYSAGRTERAAESESGAAESESVVDQRVPPMPTIGTEPRATSDDRTHTPHIIQPVRTPYGVEYQLEIAEKTELELEDAYQNSLKDRLDERSRQTGISLERLSGDHQEPNTGMVADSLEFQQRDSLEEDSTERQGSGTYRTDKRDGNIEQNRMFSRDSLEMGQLARSLKDVVHPDGSPSPETSPLRQYKPVSGGIKEARTRLPVQLKAKPVGPIVRSPARSPGDRPKGGPAASVVARQIHGKQVVPSTDHVNQSSPFTMGGQAWGKNGQGNDTYDDAYIHGQRETFRQRQEQELFLKREEQVYLQQQLQLKHLQLEELQQQQQRKQQQETGKEDQEVMEKEEQEQLAKRQQDEMENERQEQLAKEQQENVQQKPQMQHSQQQQQQSLQQHYEQQYRVQPVGHNEGVYDNSNANNPGSHLPVSVGARHYYGDPDPGQHRPPPHDQYQFQSPAREPHSRTSKMSVSPHGVDYIQANKEVKKTSSYKQIFASRKISKKSISQKPLVARQGEWDQASSANDSAPSSATALSGKTTSAEVLWRNRVPALGQRQPLRKFPSDSRLESQQGAYSPEKMAPWHPAAAGVNTEHGWGGQMAPQDNFVGDVQRVIVDLPVFQSGTSRPVGSIVQPHTKPQPIGPIRQQPNTDNPQYYNDPASQPHTGAYRPAGVLEPTWHRYQDAHMDPPLDGAAHGYPQGDADYSDPGEMVWSNAESPAHYKDQYRDQSRDQYKDQYRDQYRDHYKDQYRDQYRDPQRDLYRDHQRDPYRDQYRDPHRDQAPLGKPPTPLGSPYRVLPPIGLSDTEEYTGVSAKSSDWDSKGSLKGADSEGGYMSQYDRQRQHKIEYKEYTLDDYKKLKKEVRLGGLGPDLENESFRHKRDRIQRQVDYAKEVSERNRKAGQQTSGKSSRRTSYMDEKEIAVNRRKQAMNYAKTVPKPKLAPKTSQGEIPSSVGSRLQNHDVANLATTASFETDLSKLQQRHEMDRRQAEVIRTTVRQKGVVLSPSQHTLSSEA